MVYDTHGAGPLGSGPRPADRNPQRPPPRAGAVVAHRPHCPSVIPTSDGTEAVLTAEPVVR